MVRTKQGWGQAVEEREPGVALELRVKQGKSCARCSHNHPVSCGSGRAARAYYVCVYVCVCWARQSARGCLTTAWRKTRGARRCRACFTLCSERVPPPPWSPPPPGLLLRPPTRSPRNNCRSHPPPPHCICRLRAPSRYRLQAGAQTGLPVVVRLLWGVAGAPAVANMLLPAAPDLPAAALCTAPRDNRSPPPPPGCASSCPRPSSPALRQSATPTSPSPSPPLARPLGPRPARGSNQRRISGRLHYLVAVCVPPIQSSRRLSHAGRCQPAVRPPRPRSTKRAAPRRLHLFCWPPLCRTPLPRSAAMLQQILDQMFVDPELLAELSKDQVCCSVENMVWREVSRPTL